MPSRVRWLKGRVTDRLHSVWLWLEGPVLLHRGVLFKKTSRLLVPWKVLSCLRAEVCRAL